MITPKFALGQVIATQGALASLSLEDITLGLNRHLRGDWGDLCADDKRANEIALAQGTRLLSAYTSRGEVRFWIITEWDRSVTTVLLPEEY